MATDIRMVETERGRMVTVDGATGYTLCALPVPSECNVCAEKVRTMINRDGVTRCLVCDARHQARKEAA